MCESVQRYLTPHRLAAVIAVTPVPPLVTGAAVVEDPLRRRGAPATFADQVERLSPAVVAATPAGKEVTIAALRGGTERDFMATIGRMPAKERS